MANNILKFQRKAESLFTSSPDLLTWLREQPVNFTAAQCAEAREMLNWTITELASRSGVSELAILEFEQRERLLNEVTLRALAYSLEQEGLVFIPGLKPMRGEDARGVLEDPSMRDDFHMLE